jgi:hypothetical protein
MNYSRLFVLCLFTAVFAFAQFPWENKSEDASTPSSPEGASAPAESPIAVQTPPPASSSSAEKPTAPEGKTIFDNLRGHAYNPYSTQGAASTVQDLITLPSDIYGQKFFYVSPTDFLGYTAFGLGSGSALLGLDNSPIGGPAALILGYATPDFGLALNYSVSKIWESDSDADASTRTTYPGDNIGLYFSIPLGGATLYANASWLTYARSYSADYNGNKNKEDFSTIEAIAGLNGKSGSLNYDGYLDIMRTGGTRTNNDGDKFVDEYTYSGFALGIDLGYSVLQSSTARVILGLNNLIGMVFMDKTDDIEGDNVIAAVISPNILAEVSLFDNWLAFAGAMHSLNLISGDLDRNSDTSLFGIQQDRTNAFTGIRYQKTNWAFEAQVSANVFNNPFGGFNGSNIFVGFGGFIYF